MSKRRSEPTREPARDASGLHANLVNQIALLLVSDWEPRQNVRLADRIATILDLSIAAGNELGYVAGVKAAQRQLRDLLNEVHRGEFRTAPTSNLGEV